MPNPCFSSPFRIVVTSLLATALCACSPEAKKAKIQAKADNYFKAGEYDKAEIEYKNVLQVSGLDPWALAQLGIIYFDQGRIVRAGPHLLKALELHPDYADARAKLGYYHIAVGRPAEARDAAIFILERNPQHEVAPILLAESTAQLKDINEARARLQQLPQTASVVTALGLLELRMRKTKEAEVLFDRARQLDPKLAYPLASLAQIYLDRKDPEQAEKALTAAVALSAPRSPVRLQHAQFNVRIAKTDAAKALLDEMIRTTPDLLASYVMRADIALTEKKPDESIGLVEKVLAREQFYPEAMLLAGKAYLEKGDNDKAIAMLEKATAAFPQASQMHLQLGNAYLAKGDLDRANASFSEALKLTPTSPMALLPLARVNIVQRNFTSAIALLQGFLKQNPQNAEAFLLLGDAYRHQGNLEEALKIYRQFGDGPNANPQMHLAIGSILLQQNKKAEARVAFEKAATLAPDFLPATEQLVNLDLAEQKPAVAQTRIEKQLAKSPANAQAQFLLAKVHLAQNDNAKTEAALQKTIELDPEAAGAYLLLAQIYIKTNQVDKAIANLQAAATRNPKDAGPALTLGVLQQQKGDFKAARENYEKVLAINPKAVAALNNLAYLQSEHFGELDQALELAQRARDLSPNRGESADTLGWVLYKKGQYARAVALLQDSAEKVPDNAEMQFHLGMAHYMMGQEEPARRILERALQLSGTFAGHEEARESLTILALDAQAADAARPMLEKALSRRKDDPVALTRIAAIYEREGNADKALGAFETALKANPSNVNAAVNAIRLYRARKDLPKAMALANATRSLAPSDGRIAHALGRLAFESGNRPSSVGVLQEAARRLDNNPEVLFDLAEASYSVGHVDAAQTALQQALSSTATFSRAAPAREFAEMLKVAQNPAQAAAAAGTIERILKADAANVPALMARGALDEQKNDLKSAKANYEKALARFPEFTPAMKRLALLYSSDEDVEKKAAEIATKAREAFPNDAELAKASGIIFFRTGNHARAVNLLQDAARTQPNDAAVMYYLGMSQSQLKQGAASTKSLQRALELGLAGKMEADAKKTLAAATK